MENSELDNIGYSLTPHDRERKRNACLIQIRMDTRKDYRLTGRIMTKDIRQVTVDLSLEVRTTRTQDY